MSRESTTYIGPYLEIISGGTYEKPYIYYGCPDHGKMPFDYCPKCGKKVVQLESIETYHHDINSMTGELVWQPDYMPEGRDIYIYNGGGDELKTQSIYELDPGILYKTVVEETESFMKELISSGSLKAMNEKGIKYRISFGVINYTH